jgi:exosortase A
MADGSRFLGTEAPALAPSRWHVPLAVLLAVLAAFGFAFREEVAAAIRVWDSSTAYNHCWLVLPIAGWLAWQRRERLALLSPRPMPAALLLLVPGTLAWLVAERLGIMEGRQLVLMGLVWLTVLAVMGWQVTLAMVVPLAYLIFLVPFGAFTVPALQKITAWQIELLLGLTDIPHYIDELVIEIPAGSFLVAEACAGLRFLIAALAFGALYAVVMFRSPWRRAAVLVLSVVVPIVANGFRAFGLVMLGHFQGSAAAVAADHVIYGWVFFSLVIVLLILAGLPFRQDEEALGPLPFRHRPSATTPARALAPAVGLGAALLVLAGPVAAGALGRLGTEPPQAVAPRLTIPERCEATSEPATLRCQGMMVTARLLVFPAQAKWATIAAERRRAQSGDDEDATFAFNLPGALWQGRQPDEAARTVAVAAWLDGQPAGDGLRSRARQAWNAFRGEGSRPVLAVLELVPADQGTPRDRDVLRFVAEAQETGLARQAAALSRPAGGR